MGSATLAGPTSSPLSASVPLEPFRVVPPELPSFALKADGLLSATLPFGSPAAVGQRAHEASNGAAPAASVNGAAATSPAPTPADDLDDPDDGDGFFNTPVQRGGTDSVRPSYADDDAVLTEDFSDGETLKRRRVLTPQQELRRVRFVRLVASVIGFGVAVFLVALVVSYATGDDAGTADDARPAAAEPVDPMAAQPAAAEPAPALSPDVPPPAPANTPEATADAVSPPSEPAPAPPAPAPGGAAKAPKSGGAAARGFAPRLPAAKKAPAPAKAEAPEPGARPPTASFPSE